MSYEFRICDLEMDYKSYVKFLLTHHNELNLPYPFAMKLSFLSSPLLFGKAIYILNDDPYEIVGAAGYVYGTGAKEYTDREVCQIEVAFLKKEYRTPLLFIQGLQYLISKIKEGNPDVKTVQFWISEEDEYLKRLFSKFLDLSGSNKAIVNNLALYTIVFKEFEQFVNRFIKFIIKEEG